VRSARVGRIALGVIWTAACDTIRVELRGEVMETWIAKTPTGQVLVTITSEGMWVAQRKATGDTWGPPTRAEQA